MDEKNVADTNLSGADVQNLRQILEHRFPPPETGGPASARSSLASVLDREEPPWWWSPSADAQPSSSRDSRVLDCHHLLSTEMLARTVALSAQRARDKMYSFVQSMAKQRGEDWDEKLDAWDGFGLDFMPRITKQPGNPPNASYFYKAKIEKDIQNIHIVLQYFAVLIEEILHDQEKFNCPTKTKWEEMAEMLKQLLREVDVVLAALELPRRRVPRSAIPQYARGLPLRDARDARDWLAARDLLNAVELLWHIFSVFAAAADARRESQLRASTTVLSRYGSNYNYARQRASSSSLLRDASASQVILPYATISPVPGRPSAATKFLYGVSRDPMPTPRSSPASVSCQQVDHYFPPRVHPSKIGPESPPRAPEMYLSFDLPQSLSPPSKYPRKVPSSTSPRRGSPHDPGGSPGDATDSHSPGGGPPGIFSPRRITSRPTALSHSSNLSSPVPSCCLPPPKPQIPPPFFSHTVRH